MEKEKYEHRIGIKEGEAKKREKFYKGAKRVSRTKKETRKRSKRGTGW